MRVNQDTLGNRSKCLRLAQRTLQNGQCPIIDRCNASVDQRRHWTRLAAEHQKLLGADTVVAVGRRVLPKAEDAAEVGRCLALLSGRAHRVLTGVAVAAPDGRVVSRLVESKVRFKRLSDDERRAYIETGEGVGKAGGYAIQGYAGALVMSLQGSYSAIVGLPLYETAALLAGVGFRPS